MEVTLVLHVFKDELIGFTGDVGILTRFCLGSRTCRVTQLVSNM